MDWTVGSLLLSKLSEMEPKATIIVGTTDLVKYSNVPTIFWMSFSSFVSKGDVSGFLAICCLC